jgi:hypothetical protein
MSQTKICISSFLLMQTSLKIAGSAWLDTVKTFVHRYCIKVFHERLFADIFQTLKNLSEPREICGDCRKSADRKTRGLCVNLKAAHQFGTARTPYAQLTRKPIFRAVEGFPDHHLLRF